MATTSTLRSRRSAAQLQALVQVEREIRASDPNSRRKYLRDFNEAFRTYQSVLSREQLQALFRSADVLLLGDYHALPASQNYAARLVEELAGGKRPLILGVETVFARDQHILDEWAAGEIDEDELRERLHFDYEWGYLWEPFYELLQSARSANVPVYGLDCLPRLDLRKIAARDRHAVEKIAELRSRYAGAQVLVLFGESHLAPNHIPELLTQRLPKDRVLTVLQNIDPLYWKAAGERRERVEAVRVNEDAVCVFNSTPLEKYESYRLCLDRWTRESAAAPDFAPTVYNLIDSLAHFLNMNSCSSHNGRQPKFLVDLLPEVCCREDERLSRILQRKIAGEPDRRSIRARLEEYGTVYLPGVNSLYVREFQMMHVAEEATRFLHHACRGSVRRWNGNNDINSNGNGHRFVESKADSHRVDPKDRFYTRVLEQALGYFGSRILYPARPPVRESDLYALYTQSPAEIEEKTIYSYAEYMRTIDFLVMHKDYETAPRRYLDLPALVQEGVRATGAKFEYVTRRLGYMMGTELYDAYLAGRISKRFLRSLFMRKLDRLGSAPETYFAVVRKIHGSRKKKAAI
ncbi:MAG TPA: ChaN family lipoprotein [Terriglobales bacterium]|nr:ChaN family lipoprotein [Terriglobales bacterium]